MRIILFAAVAAAISPTAFAEAPESIALHCPRLVDVDAGKLLGETTVVIEGTRIKEVRDGRVDVAGAKVIDLHDATCLPGLIDAHVHLTGETSPTRYVDDF